MLDENTPITLKLTLKAVGIIIQGLGELQTKMTFDLLKNIMSEVEAQTKPPAPESAPSDQPAP